MIGRRDFNKATISSALGTAVALVTGLNRTPAQETPIKSVDTTRKYFVPFDNERAWLFTFYDNEIKDSSDWTVNGIRASVSVMIYAITLKLITKFVKPKDERSGNFAVINTNPFLWKCFPLPASKLKS